ncbi:MAG: VirB8/TrbF family protein [Rickettsiales bacterium]
MSDDAKQLAEMIRSGAYYKESRAWYAALYIGPISERSFFLLVAMLASFVALFGIIAMTSLLPLTSRPGIVIRSDRPDDVVPHVQRIKPTGAPIEPAMERNLIALYVKMRESYEYSHYTSNYAFIVAHSDQPTAAYFAKQYSSTNPQSLAAQLGYNGQRLLFIDSVVIDDKVEPRTATISWRSELINLAVSTIPARGTTRLQYYYTPMVVTPGTDEAGRPITTTQDPQFQVVSYDIIPAR